MECRETPLILGEFRDEFRSEFRGANSGDRNSGEFRGQYTFLNCLRYQLSLV